jgi:CHAT domain
MPEPIYPARALKYLESIMRELQANLEQLDRDSREQVRILDLEFRQAYKDAASEAERAALVVRFLEALDQIPDLPRVVKRLIATCREPDLGGSRGFDGDSANAFPESTHAEPVTAAPVLEPEPVVPGFQPGFPEEPVGAETSSEPPTAASHTRELGEPEAASPNEPSHAPLTRYPELEFPTKTVLDQANSLTVSLLRQPSSPQATGPVIVIADRQPDPPQLEVVVRAKGFEIDGGNTRKMIVSRDDDTEVRFNLIAREPGEQTVRVDFYQDNRCIGTIRTNTMIAAPGQDVLALRSTPEASKPESLEFARAGAVPPDLELCVEVDPHDGKTLHFTLHSSKANVDFHHKRVGSVTLQASPLEKMQAVYKDLNTFAGNEPATKEASETQTKRISSWGQQLWDDLFPEDLKRAYWTFRDQVQTLLITSEEPWIPWEMIKPYRFDDQGTRLEDPHLCERFVIARWLSGPGMADTLPVKDVRPVVPDSNLAAAQPELRYLETMQTLNPGLRPGVPYSDRAQVLDLLENGRFEVLHVASHGQFNAQNPENSSLALNDGLLQPLDVRVRFGAPRPRPLVFLNTCHGARQEFSFTGLGGWASTFVKSKVGAFIGASWEVSDALALEFAEAFYQALLKDGLSLGESMQRARLVIRDRQPANSTWLAYVLYADPNTRAAVAKA